MIRNREVPRLQESAPDSEISAKVPMEAIAVARCKGAARAVWIPPAWRSRSPQNIQGLWRSETRISHCAVKDMSEFKTTTAAPVRFGSGQFHGIRVAPR